MIDESPAGKPEVAPPTGLALIEEPKANVERYDGLRGRTGVRQAAAALHRKHQAKVVPVLHVTKPTTIQAGIHASYVGDLSMSLA